MTGFIRTLGADLPASDAGPTYTHEHLIIDSPFVGREMPHIRLDSVDEGVTEVSRCVAAGVRTMVDAMPAASGRNPEKLTNISIRSGMRVVAATGLHTERYYEDVGWTRTERPEDLAKRFIADIEVGIDKYDYLGPEIDRSDVRAGLIKVGSLTERLSERDHRLFDAAAITSDQTGAPILTHTEGGLGGLGQIEKLLKQGVAPDRIAVSHTDKIADQGYHREMLSAGVFLCYDQGLRQPDATMALLEAMIDSGYADQLLLGTDGARRDLWQTLGGSPGLAFLYEGFAEPLAEKRNQLFVNSPARWLTFAS